MNLILKQLLLLSILINLSCTDNDVQNLEKNSFIQSVILPDTITMGSPFNIEFELSVSGCQTYSRFELNKDQENIFLKVFTQNQTNTDPDVNCLTGLFTEKVIEEIQLNSIGEKQIIINDSTIVKTIFIKE